MADISIVKIKARRGTDAQRKRVVLDQGEFGYTTDTARLFVGNGALSGGNVVSNKSFNTVTSQYMLTSVPGQIGDTINAENRQYRLKYADYTSLSAWEDIGVSVDNTSIEYNNNNELSIKSDSLSADSLNMSVAGNGITHTGTNIAVDISPKFKFTPIDAKLDLESDSVTNVEISSASFGDGITGGSGTAIGLNVSTQFSFTSGGQLELITAAPSGSIGYDALDPTFIGTGLYLNSGNNTLNTTVSDVDNITLGLSVSGVAGLKQRFASGDSQESAYVEYDEYGLVSAVHNSIAGSLTGIGIDDAVDMSGTPIGTILPHANAYNAVHGMPDDYIACDGTSYPVSAYPLLFDVIGGLYGSVGGGTITHFSVPDLTGNMIIGEIGEPSDTINETVDTTSGVTDVLGVNFIIKAQYSATTESKMFNGYPAQTSGGAGVVYTAVNSTGDTISLSSAGFITFEGGSPGRLDGTTINKYAIPIFAY